MHKQHEDQPSNELPNLSTWHPVPVGATLHKNTPYAYAYVDRLTVELDGYPRDTTVSRDDCTYYTEHPIAPPLPTEEGAMIMASNLALPLAKGAFMLLSECSMVLEGNFNSPISSWITCFA